MGEGDPFWDPARKPYVQNRSPYPIRGGPDKIDKMNPVTNFYLWMYAWGWLRDGVYCVSHWFYHIVSLA